MDQSGVKERKNYPGDVREVGTKDFAVILSNLMNYRNQLAREQNDQRIGELIAKIAEKIKELGYIKQSMNIKKKLGRRKQGKFQDVTPKKKNDAIEAAVSVWEDAKKKHDEVRNKRKEEEKRALQELKAATRRRRNTTRLTEEEKQELDAKVKFRNLPR